MIRIIPVLAAFFILYLGCQDIPVFPSPSPPPPTAKPEKGRTLVMSEDRALLAVQEYLLSKATSAKAKVYLTDLYASGGKWSAKSELLKDGTRVFNVMLEIDNKDGKIKPHWRQASWTVFDDGKVLPSPKYDANALRIEADLQGLSDRG